MIREVDHDILRAFIERESHMYKWKPDGDEETRRQAFIDRMFYEITSFKSEGCNYVHIQSLTNMGCLDSALMLTGNPWVWERDDIFCTLPASPTGKVGFLVVGGRAL